MGGVVNLEVQGDLNIGSSVSCESGDVVLVKPVKVGIVVVVRNRLGSGIPLLVLVVAAVTVAVTTAATIVVLFTSRLDFGNPGSELFQGSVVNAIVFVKVKSDTFPLLFLSNLKVVVVRILSPSDLSLPACLLQSEMKLGNVVTKVLRQCLVCIVSSSQRVLPRELVVELTLDHWVNQDVTHCYIF